MKYNIFYENRLVFNSEKPEPLEAINTDATKKINSLPADQAAKAQTETYKAKGNDIFKKSKKTMSFSNQEFVLKKAQNSIGNNPKQKTSSIQPIIEPVFTTPPKSTESIERKQLSKYIDEIKDNFKDKDANVNIIDIQTFLNATKGKSKASTAIIFCDIFDLNQSKSHEYAKALQYFLKDEGHLIGQGNSEIDGIIGPKTKNALVKYANKIGN